MAEVMTVMGPIDEAALGVTLPHEHIFINLMSEYKGEGFLGDRSLAELELSAFARSGGKTIVDCTSADLDRDPQALRDMSQRTGLNIVMGCGYYRDPYVDTRHVDRHSIEELTAELIREIRDGVGNTGIRPGVIGEVGSNRRWISAVEERVLRVAARAHLATGLPIMTHAARWPLGIPQLDILAAEGVDPQYVIVGHCDMVPSVAYHEAIARRGAFVEFDTIRGESEHATETRVDYVMRLIRAGFIDRILLSHDVCLTSLYQANGGRGYAFILHEFMPRLQAAGLTEAEVEVLLVDNPRRALVAGASR
jgi:predicted metal-dependent phosphotriesterase family hydrolase